MPYCPMSIRTGRHGCRMQYLAFCLEFILQNTVSSGAQLSILSNFWKKKLFPSHERYKTSRRVSEWLSLTSHSTINRFSISTINSWTKARSCHNTVRNKKDGYRQRNVRISFCNQPKAHFGLPWVRPWGNPGKCYIDEIMKRGFNACQKHRSVPIYLQPFTSNSEILVGNCNFFIPPCI